MNKRAQIFTVIAIFLIALIFLTVELFPFFKERQADSTRVSTMNSFLFSLEKNLERQMYISGFRIIFLADTHIRNSGAYIDVNDFFREAFFNGTVNDVPNAIMMGVTYSNLTYSINEKARKMNVNITMTNPRFIISQEDPWHVKFTLKTDFIMNDVKDLVKWEKEQEVSAFVPIYSFPDPLYTIASNARAPRNITKTIYEGNYDESSYGFLQAHYVYEYYTFNPDAPSFLKRLEGDLSSDINGIESFVRVDKLESGTINKYDPLGTKSVIDHIYFNQTDLTTGDVVAFNPMFRIDTGHELKYNITI